MTKVKTLLLTRPQAQSRGLAQEITTRFPEATCLISPLIEISTVGALPNMVEVQALIFTSVNGVRAYGDLGGPTNMQCFCTGERTARAARALGLQATSAMGGASEIIAMVVDKLAPSAGELLHIHGEHTAGDIVGELSLHGFTVKEVVLYTQNSLELSNDARAALAAGHINLIPLFSPRTAAILAAEITANPNWPRDGITAVCMSQNVAAEVKNCGFGRLVISKAPNGAQMFEATAEVLR